MLAKQDIETFVSKDLLSGEELHYVSKIELPKFELKKFVIGFISVLVVSILGAMLFEYVAKVEDPNRFMIASCICGAIVICYLLWGILFYKKSTRQIVSVTSLRFLIYEYKSGLDKLKTADELDSYENRKDITFDNIESMKLKEKDNNTGLLAMVFDQENDSKTGWETAKLHLEIDDCSALRIAIPDRMRPEGSKDDFWERTYDD